MEILMIILTSTIISTLLLASFFLGTHFPREETIKLNKSNAQKIKEINDWVNFNGGRK